MKCVNHTCTIGDTIHGLIRKYNRHDMSDDQIDEMMIIFNRTHGQSVPRVGESVEIPQWEEYELPEYQPKDVQIITKPEALDEESLMRMRQERRQKARLAKRGDPSVVKVEETKIRTTNNPAPKPIPDEIINAGGLPARELTEKEQQVLRDTLMTGVAVVDEGELVETLPFHPPVELKREVVDNMPAEPTSAERIAAKRRMARERRRLQLEQRK